MEAAFCLPYAAWYTGVLHWYVGLLRFLGVTTTGAGLLIC